MISAKLATPGSSSRIRTGTRYGLEILHKCGKGVES